MLSSYFEFWALNIGYDSMIVVSLAEQVHIEIKICIISK